MYQSKAGIGVDKTVQSACCSGPNVLVGLDMGPEVSQVWPVLREAHLKFLFLTGCRGSVNIPTETTSRKIEFYCQDP